MAICELSARRRNTRIYLIRFVLFSVAIYRYAVRLCIWRKPFRINIRKWTKLQIIEIQQDIAYIWCPLNRPFDSVDRCWAIAIFHLTYCECCLRTPLMRISIRHRCTTDVDRQWGNHINVTGIYKSINIVGIFLFGSYSQWTAASMMLHPLYRNNSFSRWSDIWNIRAVSLSDLVGEFCDLSFQ